MEKFYRTVLVGLILLQLAWFYIPWGFAYSHGAHAALVWVGANSILDGQTIVLISSVLTFTYVTIYLGLIFFQRWARLLLLFITLGGGLAIPLYGISVESGYEALLGYFLTLGEGLVIGLSFFSSVSRKFAKADV
ncbi:hypothetical protein F6455_05220 [Proteobacteria bacterium 005FR1]|nr:hypothetical protein [Proteobacteria bacterium 005FR1]